MTVPIHNLYDFVHQVTENNYMLKYFYPWGSRNIDQVIDHLAGKDEHRKNFLQLETEKIFGNDAKLFGWTPWQPVLFCHDQEPLNFELYTNSKLNLRQIKNGEGVIPIHYRKKWILLHSEDNSKDLDLYQNSGLFNTAHWWSHAMLSLDWYRYAEHDQRLNEKYTIKKFLIYCRATDGSRQYRNTFLNKIDPSICQIGSFAEDNVSSNSSAIYNVHDHVHTDVSVVLETVVDRIHLTEKICRAMVCKHPFLLLAGAGSLEYIKKYGFKTFMPLIDESYDKEANLEKRMDMIVQQMHRIKMFTQAEMNHLRSIAQYNFERFFSKDFFDCLVKELQQNVSKAHCNELDYKTLWKSNKKNFQNNQQVYTEQRPYLVTLMWHIKKGGTLENYVPPWEK